MPTIVDTADYQRLYRATRRIGPEVRRAFRKRLREAAKVGQRAARAKVREMPATHRYTRLGHGRHFRARPVGLRSTLALNVGVRVTGKDVRIEQRTRGLVGRNAAGLPRGIDRGQWTHPTYGHPPKVVQKGWPYFTDEIASKKDEMLDRVRVVLDDVVAALERLGGA